MKKPKKVSAVARLQEVLERAYLIVNEDGDLGLCINVANADEDINGLSVTPRTAPFLTDRERNELNGNGKRGVVDGRAAIAKTLDWLASGGTTGAP